MLKKEVFDKITLDTEEIPFKLKQVGTLPELEICEPNQVSSKVIFLIKKNSNYFPNSNR